MKTFKISILIVGLSFHLIHDLYAQDNVMTPDLTKIVSGEGWRVVNREPEILWRITKRVSISKLTVELVVLPG